MATGGGASILFTDAVFPGIQRYVAEAFVQNMNRSTRLPESIQRTTLPVSTYPHPY